MPATGVEDGGQVLRGDFAASVPVYSLTAAAFGVPAQVETIDEAKEVALGRECSTIEIDAKRREEY